MNHLISLLVGFFAASVGVLPPGLLNMTALKIYLSEGRMPAKKFVVGAVTVIGLECFLALWFAGYLDQHPEVILVLREIGCCLFFLLSLYFFYLVRHPKPVKEASIGKSRNWLGMGLVFSALNFLNVPFYLALSLAFAGTGCFYFTADYFLVFILGVILGSFSGFYAFIQFFQRNPTITKGAMRHMNLIVGCVLFFIAMITLGHILRYYFP